jgi:pyrophosphate--fructose-6-phosphate 1-phosphotransferase
MGIFDMIKKLNADSRMFGFIMGPKGVFANKYMEIDAEYMHQYRNMGGFDMICKSQTFVFLFSPAI